MTMPPQEIEVLCPQCGRVYKDWYRPSINLSLGEEWSEEELDEATSSTCPHCQFKVSHAVLIVGEDGVWYINTGQPPPPPLKHFYGVLRLDPLRMGRDASMVAERIVRHLSEILGADIAVKLEIIAELPEAASGELVREVTENCRILKFDSYGFGEAAAL